MQPTAKDYAEEAKWRKALEPIIREQIAREIEARIVERGENEPWDKDINAGLREAAAIARGEPNQVTKDAIEEARKMNDTR